MYSTKSIINIRVSFFTLINVIITKLKQQKNKIHDYSQFVCGRDYVLEAVSNFTYYMTAQSKGVKRGDYVMLKNGPNSELYQIEEIDYYSDPSDMWMALLKKVVAE
ncbi:hypothetical protein [Iningainema tapete]|uniref:Uncharacterized protein n=1 Tax=Iningainema tapete BLCC-T55 TaxID=2748662 RepID=A0A8J6XW40_9CYAN|nr:hypothetical protein [Iningainema tapete]MBD2777382.1 hypothetical protein [Iningainema tapete BLCC-T55]